MQFIRGLINLPKNIENTAITIGNFDGVHRGHQALLSFLIAEAEPKKLQTIVIIFEPQPNEFFLKEEAPARLMRLREKIDAILNAVISVDYLLCLPFNKTFSQMSAEHFVSEFLVKKLKMKLCVVGNDFRFGAKRAGDFDLLKHFSAQYSFELKAMPDFQEDDQRVSSTLIRNHLKAGDMLAVKKYLGCFYSMSGKVIQGNKLGRTLGFPTANIYLHRNVVPFTGIFVVRVLGLDKIYYGAANVGVRPTLNQNSTRVLLEVFILDFSEEIYSRHLTVEFLHKIRDEERFATLDLLRERIAEDVKITREWLKNSDDMERA